MMTMSDEGERTCPLCMEEMDFTDQQLKPCKCGYEICVWCWHHIIEMAEKEGTEGRCPACRSTYDKERIVSMASNCEKVVSEINMERRQKSQKAKPKTTAEARKHLGSVRVIQRNLVYIIGLPSSLADESMLKHREYFGQYGKVIKVSISRPAGGAPQASSSNAFNVYITYAKEEEAVRCIQAVHNFVLDGRSLRACFGTTKYCHAWLRSMPCSNPDCFYLHDIGNQEDSFSKDEIISAYTRSRVPQIIPSNLQRRSGSTLPPPVDDFCSNGTTSTKIIVKSPSNSSTMPSKSSPPNVVAARSNVLPAAASWGSRASHPTSTSCLQGPSKQIQGGAYHTSNLPSAGSSISQASTWHDGLIKHGKLPGNDVGHVDTRSKPVELSKAGKERHSKAAVSNFSDDSVSARQFSAWNDEFGMESKSPKRAHLPISNGELLSIESPKSYSANFQAVASNSSADVEHIASAWDDDDDEDVDVMVPNLSRKNEEVTQNGRYEPVDSLESDSVKDFRTSITNINTVDNTSHTVQVATSNSYIPAVLEDADDADIHQQEKSCSRQGYHTQSSSIPDGLIESRTPVNGNIQSLCTDLSSVKLDADSTVCNGLDKLQFSPRNDILAGLPPSENLYTENHFEHLSLKQPSTVHAYSHISSEPSGWTSELLKPVSSGNGDERTDNLEASNNQRCRYSGVIGHTSFPSSTQSSHIQNVLHNEQEYDIKDASEGNKAMDSNNVVPQPSLENDIRCSNEYQNGNHESSTLQSAYEYRTMSDNEEKNMFRDFRVTEPPSIKKNGCVDMRENMIISDILSIKFDPWDDSVNADGSLIKMLRETNTQNSSWKMPSSCKGQNQCQSRFSFARSEKESSLSRPFSCETETSQVNGVGQDPASLLQNCATSRNLELAAHFSHVQSTPPSSVLKAKISAPPGFSVPNRAPPPGFSSNDRVRQTYDNMPPGLSAFSSVKNQYQMPLADSASDVEHIDPAILAAFHKGNLPSVLNTGSGLKAFPSDASCSETDPRLQLLMQQPIAAHRAQLPSGQAGDRFLPMNDAPFYPKQFAGQNYSTLSHFAQIPSQPSRNSYISNNQWNGWSDLQNGSGSDMIEILRNEGRSLNKYFPGSVEPKFHIPNSGDLYNRTFGI